MGRRLRGNPMSGGLASWSRFVRRLGLFADFLRWRGETWGLTFSRLARRCLRCGGPIGPYAWCYMAISMGRPGPRFDDERRLCRRCAWTMPHRGEAGDEPPSPSK